MTLPNNLFDRNAKPTGIARIITATGHSYRALLWLIRNETAFRQELLLLVIFSIIACLLDITAIERALLIITLLFIMVAEVINTAIETIVDRIGLEFNALSGLAKDLGSAIVFISMVMAVIIWVSIALL